MKRILVVYYSQSGQLASIVRSLTAPLQASDSVAVDVEALQPRKRYPFPWPLLDFLDQFPEAVHERPPAIEPPAVDPDQRYDLVVLAYTVWYLAPAPPVTAFLQSEAGQRILRDTPVVTVVACRNMWLQAQERVKAMLAESGARHCDHVALTDRAPTLKTLITTPRWMFTGRRDGFWGIFPRAGVSEADVAGAERFGRALANGVADPDWDACSSLLAGLGAAPVDTRLIDSERIGRRSFLIWGRLLRAIGPQGHPVRRGMLVVYSVFLVAMIMTVVPVTMALRTLLRPLRQRAIQRQQTYFEAPSGSDTRRMTPNSG